MCASTLLSLSVARHVCVCVCVRWSPPPLLQLLCIVSRVHTHKLLTPSASRLLLSLRSHDAVGTHDLLSNFDADAAFHLSLSPVVRSSCFPVIRVPRQTLAHTNRKRQTDRGRERQPRRWEARGREVRLPHLFFRLFFLSLFLQLLWVLVSAYVIVKDDSLNLPCVLYLLLFSPASLCVSPSLPLLLLKLQ